MSNTFPISTQEPDDGIGLWLDHLDRGFTIRDDRATFAAAAAKSLVAASHDAGILVQKTRPRTPDMNAFAERFVRSVKEECTSRLVFLNQRQVEYALSEFLAHYHAERCHQGFPENVPPNPDPVFQRRKGRMVVKKRLGGLLKSYHRLAS